MTTIEEPSVNVGVNGTPESQQALLWGIDEARLRRAPLKILHGYEVPPLTGAGTTAVLQASREWARHLVRTSRRMALDQVPDLQVSTENVHENATRLLTESSEHAQLTVVGTRGTGELREFLFGSTAMRTAGHAHGAILAVRAEHVVPKRTDPTAVIVCLDGSVGSEAAVAFACDEASLRGATLIALRAWDDKPLRQGLRAYPLEVDFAAIDAAEGEALRLQLEPWRSKYPELRIRSAVLRGRPAAAVRSFLGEQEKQESERLGLVVVGSRGRNEFAGLVLGSTSQELLAHCSWPTVVVHRR